MCFGTPRDTYGDVPGLLARYRDAGPGIRRAKASGVLVSQSTIGVLGFSEGGNENAGVSGVCLTGCSFFGARGSPAGPRGGAGGKEGAGVSGVSLTGCSFFVARGSPAEPRSVPLGGGAGQ